MHRIDLPCEQTGFSVPPFDVHVKFLPSPSSAGWTLLALTSPGKPDILARWLRAQPGIEGIRVASGLAPRLLRARVAQLPAAWALVSAYGRVHHLDLSSDGHAAWFVEGLPDQILALVQHLGRVAPEDRAAAVHCRPVLGARGSAPLSRRQFEALSAAVALGYYEIPHRIDLRKLAAVTGVSLGSISELLRRAEGAVLTQYVDSSLMRWPVSEEDAAEQFRPMENVLRPEPRPAAVGAPAAATLAERDARLAHR